MIHQKYFIQNCAVLLVAAGESKRLGRPKQLLIYHGDSMINRILKIMRATVPYPIFCVLGAWANTIQEQLPAIDISVVNNPDWKEGMSSSIKIGLQHALMNHPDLDAILLLVCDQPYISADTIIALFALQKKMDTPIAASFYNGIVGTPAIFHKSFFDDLCSLTGDIGARKIIANAGDKVATLAFENGKFDIDTNDDYQVLLKELSKNDKR